MAPPALASVVVRVTTVEGYPLSDATVEILAGDSVVAVPHGELERYGLEGVPSGQATLRVSATGPAGAIGAPSGPRTRVPIGNKRPLSG